MAGTQPRAVGITRQQTSYLEQQSFYEKACRDASRLLSLLLLYNLILIFICFLYLL